MGVVQRHRAALRGVEVEPPPGLVLGVRVGVDVEQVDRAPAVGDVGGVGAEEGEAGVGDAVAVLRVDAPDAAAGGVNAGEQGAGADAEADAELDDGAGVEGADPAGGQRGVGVEVARAAGRDDPPRDPGRSQGTAAGFGAAARRRRAGGRLGVAGALGQDPGPEPVGLGRVAALLGQGGEVAAGQVAVDPRVDPGEPLGAPQGQDPPPAPLGPRAVAGVAAARRPRGRAARRRRGRRRARRRRRPAPPRARRASGGAGDQGVELAGDRVGRAPSRRGSR